MPRVAKTLLDGDLEVSHCRRVGDPSPQGWVGVGVSDFKPGVVLVCLRQNGA